MVYEILSIFLIGTIFLVGLCMGAVIIALLTALGGGRAGPAHYPRFGARPHE